MGRLILAVHCTVPSFSVNMHYVNIKIKKKSTTGVAKRIVIQFWLQFGLFSVVDYS